MLDIKTSIDERNPEALFHAAHKFKCASQNFDAQRVAEIANTLKEIGHSGSVEGAPLHFTNLEQEIERLAINLSSIKENHSEKTEPSF